MESEFEELKLLFANGFKDTIHFSLNQELEVEEEQPDEAEELSPALESIQEEDEDDEADAGE